MDRMLLSTDELHVLPEDAHLRSTLFGGAVVMAPWYTVVITGRHYGVTFIPAEADQRCGDAADHALLGVRQPRPEGVAVEVRPGDRLRFEKREWRVTGGEIPRLAPVL